MAKKKELSPEERLQEALVPEEEWPYEVPENWAWVYLGDISSIVMGQSPEGTSTTDVPAFTPLIGGAADMGELFPEATRYTKSPTKISRIGDIIICVRATLGRPIFSNGKYCLGRGVAAIRSELIQKEFLRNGLITFEQYLYDNATGTTFAQVSSAIIQKMPFPLPPLPEQHRIVERIESLFAKLDEAKEAAQAVVDGFEDRKAAILHKAFTGELTKEWREKNGISIQGWKLMQLDSLCERIFDGPFGSNLKTSDYVDNGIRVVRLENLKHLWFDDSKRSFITEQKYNTISNHTVYPTDLIMSTFIADNVKICRMPSHIRFAVNKADCIGIRLKKGIVSDYILYYLSSEKIYRRLHKDIHGSTRPRVNTKQIKAIIINMPTYDEQVEIAKRIHDFFMYEQQTKDTVESVLDQTDIMKKSILARAFRGELGTNDIQDESAVELLKRVMAAKE